MDEYFEGKVVDISKETDLAISRRLCIRPVWWQEMSFWYLWEHTDRSSAVLTSGFLEAPRFSSEPHAALWALGRLAHLGRIQEYDTAFKEYLSDQPGWRSVGQCAITTLEGVRWFGAAGGGWRCASWPQLVCSMIMHLIDESL